MLKAMPYIIIILAGIMLAVYSVINGYAPGINDGLGIVVLPAVAFGGIFLIFTIVALMKPGKSKQNHKPQPKPKNWQQRNVNSYNNYPTPEL